MRAEELISRAAARGIDLIAAAQAQTVGREKPDTETYQRRGVRVVKLLQNTGARAHGRPTPSFLELDWTVEQIGLALSEVGEIPTLAALFAWAGEQRNYLRLHDALIGQALRLRREQKWGAQVPASSGGTTFYLEHLCSMVLDEDQYPTLFQYRPAKLGEPSIYAIYCSVDESIWRRVLSERYQQLRDVFWSWLGEAAAAAQRKLREG